MLPLRAFWRSQGPHLQIIGAILWLTMQTIGETLRTNKSSSGDRKLPEQRWRVEASWGGVRHEGKRDAWWAELWVWLANKEDRSCEEGNREYDNRTSSVRDAGYPAAILNMQKRDPKRLHFRALGWLRPQDSQQTEGSLRHTRLWQMLQIIRYFFMAARRIHCLRIEGHPWEDKAKHQKSYRRHETQSKSKHHAKLQLFYAVE